MMLCFPKAFTLYEKKILSQNSRQLNRRETSTSMFESSRPQEARFGETGVVITYNIALRCQISGKRGNSGSSSSVATNLIQRASNYYDSLFLSPFVILHVCMHACAYSDGCDKEVVGEVFECDRCFGFDLCSACYDSGDNDHTDQTGHGFRRALRALTGSEGA